MNFDLTEEQVLLQDSARRFAEEKFSFDARRKSLSNRQSFSRPVWNEMAAMGWFGVAMPEELGGLGGSIVEQAIISEELGRAMSLAPYVMCGVLPLSVLRNLASPEKNLALMEAAMSGEVLIAVAHGEPESRGLVSFVETMAKKDIDGSYRLAGHKTLVVGGDVADRFIVSARISTPGSPVDPCGEAGISLFVVDPAQAGVRIDRHQLLNGQTAIDLWLDEASAESLIGLPGMAHGSLMRATDEAIVVLGAFVVGGMEDSIATTAEYLKTRKQFGVPIGSFQVLQHRMADMAIELSQARSALHCGLAALNSDDVAWASVEISGCKAQLIKSGHFVTSQAIQLHGGYGITEEYRVGHHFKNLMVADVLFGRKDFHLRRYAQRIQATSQ